MKYEVRTVALVAVAAFVEVVLILNLLSPLPGEEDAWPWVGGLTAFPVTAVLILIHRPDNRVGWALGGTAISAGLIFVMSWYPATYPGGPFSSYVEALERIAAVGQFVAIIALLYLFPTGKTAGRIFQRSLQAFFAVMAFLTVVLLLSPSPLHMTGRPNPFGVLPAWLGRLGDDGAVALLPFALVGLVSLAARWRGADVVQRSQLKWFLTGAIAAVAILVAANILPEEPGNDLFESVGGVLVLLAFWSMPAAVVVAVLRYRLYDIDRVISRTVTYALLTACLAGTYFGVVVGLQALMRSMSGGSDLAIVITTLVVAALFLPVRRRVQDAVDRRFNRRAYDANRTIEAFSSRLREQVDLDTLRLETLAVVGETMQPAHASLWLRIDREAR